MLANNHFPISKLTPGINCAKLLKFQENGKVWKLEIKIGMDVLQTNITKLTQMKYRVSASISIITSNVHLSIPKKCLSTRMILIVYIDQGGIRPPPNILYRHKAQAHNMNRRTRICTMNTSASKQNESVRR